jgi:hypothetical protein
MINLDIRDPSLLLHIYSGENPEEEFGFNPVGGVTRLHFLAEKISSLILYPS